MSEPAENPVTRLLGAVEAGDPKAADQLLPVVYAELRRMAQHLVNAERAGHSLEATALVHDAYVRLVGGGEGEAGDHPRRFADRRHFFNAAALAMRRVLLDRARSKARPKHGGGGGSPAREGLDAIDIPATQEFGLDRMEVLDRALTELNAHNRRWAEVVQLRYFLGLSVEQTAQTLGLSPATVKSDWTFARAWLRHTLRRATE